MTNDNKKMQGHRFGILLKKLLSKVFVRKQKKNTPTNPQYVVQRKKDIHDVVMDQIYGPEGGEGKSW